MTANVGLAPVGAEVRIEENGPGRRAHRNKKRLSRARRSSPAGRPAFNHGLGKNLDGETLSLCPRRPHSSSRPDISGARSWKNEGPSQLIPMPIPCRPSASMQGWNREGCHCISWKSKFRPAATDENAPWRISSTSGKKPASGSPPEKADVDIFRPLPPAAWMK